MSKKKKAKTDSTLSENKPVSEKPVIEEDKNDVSQNNGIMLFSPEMDLIIPDEQSNTEELSEIDKMLASDLFYSDSEENEYDSEHKTAEELQKASDTLSLLSIDDSGDNGEAAEPIKSEEDMKKLLSFEGMDSYAEENEMKPFAVKNEKVHRVLVMTFSVIFLASVISLAVNLINYKRAADIYNNLRKFVNGDSLGYDSLHYSVPYIDDAPSLKLLQGYSGKDNYEDKMRKEQMQQFYEKIPLIASLDEINSDVCGWITVSGTKIDYPFVRGTDNKYYLNHTFDNTYLGAGTIFADYRNSKDISDNKNTVLYGHNMNDGSMFAGITKFKSESVFRRTVIRIITAEGVYTYTPFAVFSTDSKDRYFETVFESDSDFEEFLATYKGKSLFATAASLSASDKILTLSTCTNLLNTGRFVVMAYLSDIIE